MDLLGRTAAENSRVFEERQEYSGSLLPDGPASPFVQAYSLANTAHDQADSASGGRNTNDSTDQDRTHEGPLHHADANDDRSDRGDDEQCAICLLYTSPSPRDTR